MADSAYFQYDDVLSRISRSRGAGRSIHILKALEKLYRTVYDWCGFTIKKRCIPVADKWWVCSESGSSHGQPLLILGFRPYSCFFTLPSSVFRERDDEIIGDGHRGFVSLSVVKHHWGLRLLHIVFERYLSQLCAEQARMNESQDLSSDDRWYTNAEFSAIFAKFSALAKVLLWECYWRKHSTHTLLLRAAWTPSTFNWIRFSATSDEVL